MRLRDGFKGIDFSGIGDDSSVNYADAMSDVFGIPSAVAYSPLVSNVYSPPSSSTTVPFSTPSVSSEITALSIPFFDYVSPLNQQSAPLGPYSPSKIKNADILPDDSGDFASTASPTSTKLKSGPGKTTAYPIPDPGSDIIGSISKSLYSAGILSQPTGADTGMSITPPPASLRSKFGTGTSMDSGNAGQGRGSVKSNSPDGNSFSLLNSYFTNTGSVDFTTWPKQIIAKVDDVYKAVTGALSPTVTAPPVRAQLPTTPGVPKNTSKSPPKTGQDNSIGGTVKTVFDSLLAVLTPLAAAKQAKAGQRAASATSKVSPQSAGGGDMSTYLLIGGGVLAAGILVYVVTKD